MALRSERPETIAARLTAARRARARARRLRRGRRVVRHAVLLALALPFVIPFYWLIISAFKTNADLTSLPPTFWPHPWTLSDLRSAVGVNGFGDYVRNTAYITIFNVL